jgi:hypothetical protein
MLPELDYHMMDQFAALFDNNTSIIRLDARLNEVYAEANERGMSHWSTEAPLFKQPESDLTSVSLYRQ